MLGGRLLPLINVLHCSKNYLNKIATGLRQSSFAFLISKSIVRTEGSV